MYYNIMCVILNYSYSYNFVVSHVLIVRLHCCLGWNDRHLEKKKIIHRYRETCSIANVYSHYQPLSIVIVRTDKYYVMCLLRRVRVRMDGVDLFILENDVH